MPWRRINHEAAKAKIVEFRRQGVSLVAAARGAGVHVATVCRWQVADWNFALSLLRAGDEADKDRFHRHLLRPKRLPVPIHPLCPACNSPATAKKAFRFNKRAR
jgi:hypothetical protein